MEITTSTELKKHLNQKLNKFSQDKEPLIVRRSGKEDIVMLPLSEYNSWRETLYLLSTKANRENLEASLKEAEEDNLVSIPTKDLWK